MPSCEFKFLKTLPPLKRITVEESSFKENQNVLRMFKILPSIWASVRDLRVWVPPENLYLLRRIGKFIEFDLFLLGNVRGRYTAKQSINLLEIITKWSVSIVATGGSYFDLTPWIRPEVRGGKVC